MCESEAEAVVSDYLKEQYRPYSVSDLVLNLHNRVSKPLMIKCLDSLVKKQVIISKSYNKMVYYVYNEKTIDEEEIKVSNEEGLKSATTFETFNEEVQRLQNGVYYRSFSNLSLLTSYRL